MIIIADSGSTKTDWWIGSSTTNYKSVQTVGINPFYQDEKEIAETLNLLSLNDNEIKSITHIYFYGAGCTNEKGIIVKKTLEEAFPECTNINVESDLMAAAHALCGKNHGIAAILGTGSNSCQYDGINIIHNVSPLGFILGDEGSGATLGKLFVADGLKNILSNNLFNEFLNEYKLSAPQIMDKIYRRPFPNRFLASFTPYMYKHRNDPHIHQLLVNSFRSFFERNIKQYDYKSYKTDFIGSIAYFFMEEITEAAHKEGVEVGIFLKSPLKELVKYHLNSLS